MELAAELALDCTAWLLALWAREMANSCHEQRSMSPATQRTFIVSEERHCNSIRIDRCPQQRLARIGTGENPSSWPKGALLVELVGHNERLHDIDPGDVDVVAHRLPLDVFRLIVPTPPPFPIPTDQITSPWPAI